MKQNNKTNKKDNKRCCSANGFSLLPLALQSRLFCLFRPSCLVVIIITTLISLVISSLYLNVNSTSADSKIVLSIPNPSINLDVLPISAAGNFKSSSNMAINVSTDYYAGYTLGISAKASNGNSLINQDDNTKTLTSINNLVSETNYKDDTYAITNSLNNTWGIRPDTVYNSNSSLNESNTNYLPISSDASEQIVIAHTTSNSNSDNYNISIGTRIDANIPAGIYQNTFVVTAVANPAPYSITYNQNTEDTVTNMPTPNPDTGTTYDGSVNVSSSIPERPTYVFRGWCTTSIVDEATCDSPNTQYSPDDNISVTNNYITLYAVWDKPKLWEKVVEEWVAGGSRVQTNDTNVNTGIKAPITTANSGVFKYNSEAFNGDTDATKPDGTKYDIYYFRGILDNAVGTYGSDGDGEAWPNYVLLDLNNNGAKDTTDTCWRIVRTTASGGTKMIYGGKYGATTAGSCANATTNARLTTKAFNDSGNISTHSIIAAGYTFNNNYAATEADTPYGTLFGTNSNYSGNTTDSTIKDYIENTWFNSTSGVSAYESILEPNAGYCNDRSLYTGSGVLVGDNDDIVTPYTTATSGVTVYSFGARGRQSSPSLACPRNEVDVYTIKTTDENNNEDKNGGNGQLKKPTALLTMDESGFAGSGSIYHANSYLRSGNSFWLFSPSRRVSSAASVYSYYLNSNGDLKDRYTDSVLGVRPVISLIYSTKVFSGTGTAVDPFVILPPQSEQTQNN